MNNVQWFKKYLISYKHWILWIVALQCITLLLGYLDYDLSLYSIFYVITLNIGLTFIFLLFAYFREIKFYRHIYDNSEIEAFKHLEWADTPLQEEVQNYLYEQITRQKALVTRQREHIRFHEESITHFVHDIKTPVTALKLMIEQEQDFSRKQALLYEWSRINEMLDKQLYLTRLDSRQHDLYFERISLKRMLIDEIQLTRHISQMKGIGFELDMDDDVEVYTDRKWCRMVIRQILSNAVKYSDSQDIRIKIDTVDGHARLMITDRGLGISAKDLPRIFERGFTSTIRRDGTDASGMGLYLVDMVTQDLSISVDIQSVLGEGTEVQLVFPHQNDVIARMSKMTTLSL